MSETDSIPSETNWSKSDYEPLHPEQKGDRKTYGGDQDGLKAAARELSDARESKPTQEASDDKNLVTRQYVRLDDGSKIEPHKTVSLREASRDLNMMRSIEGLISEEPVKERTAAAVDALRAAYPSRELPSDFVPQLQQAVEQQKAFEAQQPQEQPQVTEPQPEVTAQPEQPQQHDIDPEIKAALDNPKVRAALEAEVAQAEQARAAYQQGLQQAAAVSQAALFSQFPEIANLRTDQLATAIEVIGKTDIQKAHAIQAAVQRTQTLLNASVEMQQRQHQLQAAQLQAYAAAQHAEYEAEIRKTETPESIKRIKEAAPEVAEKYYGISRDELRTLAATQPLLHSKAMQLMMTDAIKYRLAQEAIRDPARLGAVPPVQRPGTAMARAENNNEVSRALKAFSDNPNDPRLAAELVMARRAANSRK